MSDAVTVTKHALAQRIAKSSARVVFASRRVDPSLFDSLRKLLGPVTLTEMCLDGVGESFTSPAAYRWDAAASASSARSWAMLAYQRAVSQTIDPSGTAVGIASIAETVRRDAADVPRRVFLAAQTSSRTACRAVDDLAQRMRQTDDDPLDPLLWNLLAEACGIPARVNVPHHRHIQITTTKAEAPQEWQALLSGRRTLVRHGPAQATTHRGLFAGAFAPLHDGHRRMTQLASQDYGLNVAYEISIVNVDKPTIDFLDMQQRSRQFSSEDSLWFTRAATFAEKAELFPGMTFLVGVDTIARLGDPRYYGNDPLAYRRAIDDITDKGCRFLVFGRSVRGAFRTLDEVALADPLKAICQGVPADRFREDISSTELRTPGS